jgi:hypothetical protein
VIEGDKEEMKSRYAPSRFLDRLISLNLIWPNLEFKLWVILS